MNLPRRSSTGAYAPAADRRSAKPLPPKLRCATAWLFPGLGSRYVGMGGDIIGQHRVADQLVKQASRWLGYDVAEVCLDGAGRKWVPERQEVQTTYVVGCAYSAVLKEMGADPGVVCGHSMGSWAAGYVAGVFDFCTGLELISRFDDLMEQHIDPLGHGMGVVIGLSRKQVADLCRSVPEVHLANLNCDGQYVVAGDECGVEQVLETALEQGACKIRRLPTTRAMHTPLMGDLLRRTPQALSGVRLRRPRVPMVSENDLSRLASAEDVRRYFATFLGRPVFWEATVRHLQSAGVREFVEAGPGTILTGMMPYIDRSARIQTASDLVCEALPR